MKWRIKMQNLSKTKMDEKNKKQRKSWILLGIVILLVILGGSLFFRITIQKTPCEKNHIQYGIEIQADINGDQKHEKVSVMDNVNGNNAFTQISAQFGDGETVFKDYSGYWSSYIVSGDLTEDGIEDVVLMRFSIGSTYGGGECSVLYMGEDGWKEYSHNFISNPLLEIEQPENFEQLACLGASIVPVNGHCRLRIITLEDMSKDTVKCIDCSYREGGWFIENIKIVEKYFELDKEAELLGIKL